MKIIIDIPYEVYEKFGHEYSEENFISKPTNDTILDAFCKGTPLTPYVLANMLMEERITGSLEQNMSCSREVIDDVRCKLTVEIIDRRPCYCGAELREVWRERKESAE